MRAILIDPTLRKLTEIEIPERGTPDYLEAWKNVIQAEWSIECCAGSEVDVWVDDIGVLKNKPLFRLKEYPYPLAGRGLMLGRQWNENTGWYNIVACPIGLVDAAELITWADSESSVIPEPKIYYRAMLGQNDE